MTSKKDIPLNMLKAIERIAQQNLDIIKLGKEDNSYYCFFETDINSKNYFRIYIDGSKVIGNINQNNFTYGWKPTDASNASHFNYQGNLKDVIKQFETWVKLIRDLNDTPSVHDDNFVKSYSEFYFNEFKIVDDDADTSPFNPIQQDLIELYLNSLSKAVENANDNLDEITKAELISEINEIKSTLSITTKTKVMKGITKIFGKLYKHSKILTKEIVNEAKKYLIKKLFDLGVEYGPKIIEAFTTQT